jgi:hypothetical protein
LSLIVPGGAILRTVLHGSQAGACLPAPCAQPARLQLVSGYCLYGGGSGGTVLLIAAAAATPAAAAFALDTGIGEFILAQPSVSVPALGASIAGVCAADPGLRAADGAPLAR